MDSEGWFLNIADRQRLPAREHTLKLELVLSKRCSELKLVVLDYMSSLRDPQEQPFWKPKLETIERHFVSRKEQLAPLNSRPV